LKEIFVDMNRGVEAARNSIGMGQGPIMLYAVVSSQIVEINLEIPATHESAPKAQQEGQGERYVVMLSEDTDELKRGDVTSIVRQYGVVRECIESRTG